MTDIKKDHSGDVVVVIDDSKSDLAYLSAWVNQAGDGIHVETFQDPAIALKWCASNAVCSYSNWRSFAASRIPGIFFNTSVPGYKYGSEATTALRRFRP